LSARGRVSQLAQLKGLITNVGRVVIGRIRSAYSSQRESVLSTMILGRSPSLLVNWTDIGDGISLRMSLVSVVSNTTKTARSDLAEPAIFPCPV